MKRSYLLVHALQEKSKAYSPRNTFHKEKKMKDILSKHA